MVARNHEIRIKLSAEELEQAKKKAEKFKRPLTSFIRWVLLECNINVEVTMR